MNKRKLELEYIYNTCCTVLGFDISKKDRTLETYIYGRAVYYDICFRYGKKSTLAKIGKVIGFDHATVLNAMKKIKDTYINEDVFLDMLESVENFILSIDKDKGKDDVNLGVIEMQRQRINELTEKLSILEDSELMSLIVQIPVEKHRLLIDTKIKPFMIMNV